MTTEQDKRKHTQLLRRAALIGAVLGVLCQFLPHEYRGMCTAVVKMFSVTTCGG